MEIVAATRNEKKLKEMRRLLEGTAVRIMGLEEFPGCPEVEETGETFEENAAMKAASVSGHTGRTAVSDDSGLEVFALGGAPGVRSARYAGEGASDDENVEKLLMEMAKVPEGERGARFVCVIAISDPHGGVKSFYGTVEGKIANKAKGMGGFGYDPVFIPSGHERTFAEMTASEKDSMSHRGAALRGLREYLEGLD